MLHIAKVEVDPAAGGGTLSATRQLAQRIRNHKLG